MVWKWRPGEALTPVFCPSTLSQCIHAAAALLYPFNWAHTYIPVVPESLLDTVCCPTPFMVGVQTRFLQVVLDSPMEEVGYAKNKAWFDAKYTGNPILAMPLAMLSFEV